MRDAYIFDGLRTGFGRYGGVLASIRPDDLLAAAIKGILERHPGLEDQIEDAIIGCSNQAGEDSRNIARNASILSGLPVSTPGLTVNRLCGSERPFADAQIPFSLTSLRARPIHR